MSDNRLDVCPGGCKNVINSPRCARTATPKGLNVQPQTFANNVEVILQLLPD